LLRQRRQSTLHDFLLAMMFGAQRRIRRLSSREMADRGEDADELDALVALFFDLGEQVIGVEPENAIVRSGGNWKHVIEVAGAKRPVLVFELDLLPFEDRALRVAE